MDIQSRFVAWVKGLFGVKPDPRPDPEDAVAYAHAEKVRVKQEARSFPLQSLRGRRRPHDVNEDADWAPDPAGYTSWVDVYEGPRGIGFVVNYEVTRAGKLWRKAINYGPEDYRDVDWAEVPERI